MGGTLNPRPSAAQSRAVTYGWSDSIPAPKDADRMHLDIRNLRKMEPWDAERVLYWYENHFDIDSVPAKRRNRIHRRVKRLRKELFDSDEGVAA